MLGVCQQATQSNRYIYIYTATLCSQVVIKYVPYVGDSKRAMDEYTSQIMMGGHNTLAVHNTCEDSLLAAPIILDLVLLTELCQRITFRVGEGGGRFQSFHSVLSILSYLCKVNNKYTHCGVSYLSHTISSHLTYL